MSGVLEYQYLTSDQKLAKSCGRKYDNWRVDTRTFSGVGSPLVRTVNVLTDWLNFSVKSIKTFQLMKIEEMDFLTFQLVKIEEMVKNRNFEYFYA